MRFAPLLLLALAACAAHREPPQYMLNAPKGDENAKAALAEIRKELGDEFIVDKVEGVFYVASDAGRWSFDVSKGTIVRVYAYLTATYFEKKPDRPIRVFLFKNRDSYDKYVRKAYGEDPSTPFGFYRSGERKMVMNISTGTGTLAHELVHPLLAEDFPQVPSWFNEGFASLFEQSTTDKDGRISGRVNWRLPHLHRAMREGRAIALENLMKTDSAEFYGDDRGVNYATARYFCMYLQEKEQLLAFYRRFKADAASDATGIRALEAVTGKPLADFEKEWREWVGKLEYR